MGNQGTGFCPALWFSGFFGLGAFVHLARFVFGIALTVNGQDIPLAWSGAGGLFLAALSAGCFVLSRRKPCSSGSKSEAGKAGCCGH